MLGSAACGLGDLSFLAYTSFYDISLLSFWSSGTGFSGIAGAGWVYLLNTILGVSSKVHNIGVSLILGLCILCVSFYMHCFIGSI